MSAISLDTKTITADLDRDLPTAVRQGPLGRISGANRSLSQKVGQMSRVFWQLCGMWTTGRFEVEDFAKRIQGLALRAVTLSQAPKVQKE
jgi:hypothetical protein